jgi:DNA-binding NarL/FixJ family response regulator
MEENNKVIKNVIDAGALGFLSKTGDWDELYSAIKKVSRGEFHYSEKINPILLEMIHEHKQQTPIARIEFNEREANIIHYLNEGLSSTEIGGKLYCSRATVDRIRQILIHRVGAKNTAGLLMYAIRHKLIEVDSS